MRDPLATRLLCRTAVVAVWVVALALVGGPGWLAAVLGLALVAVWAAPFLLATNRRRGARVARAAVVEPREAGPAS